MSEIQLSDITKDYGPVSVLPPLNLEIAKKSFVTLLGPSGCGKTTLLRLIAGLEEPTSGELKLDDATVFCANTGVFVPPEKRHLGLIFQSYALWPNMKVDRNITLALKEAKLTSAEIEKRLSEALAKVQLTEYRDRYPSELSGGQQQRVAVARMIAARNEILLMDEPLSNLDAVLRTDMRTELRKLHDDLNATTVYVTHDQVEALTISDVIVVMNEGRIQQVANPFEVYHSPKNLFVAEFIGDPKINVFEAGVRRSGASAALDFQGVSIPCKQAVPDHFGSLNFAIRPESIVFSTSPADDTIEVVIDRVHPTGSQTIVFASIGEVRFTVLLPGFVIREPGSKAWLHLPESEINLFDPESGENLSAIDQANQPVRAA
ncbi:MAG: ABC transporter ATP-binding protein [Rhodospirillales bacterium]|jgi:multiple sugar transport system ATP-binding protein|nr:ABC transporter ATP-binding protein [Rhodospirillales bacterium]